VSYHYSSYCCFNFPNGLSSTLGGVRWFCSSFTTGAFSGGRFVSASLLFFILEPVKLGYSLTGKDSENLNGLIPSALHKRVLKDWSHATISAPSARFARLIFCNCRTEILNLLP